MLKLIIVLSVACFSVTSLAADPTYSSPATGKLSCLMTYWAKNTPPEVSPSSGSCLICTAKSQTLFFQPEEFKQSSTMSHLADSTKQGYVRATDGQLTLLGSLEIKADDFTNGMVVIRQGSKEIGRAQGVINVHNDLQIQIPVSGVMSKDLNVFQVNATCSYQN